MKHPHTPISPLLIAFGAVGISFLCTTIAGAQTYGSSGTAEQTVNQLLGVNSSGNATKPSAYVYRPTPQRPYPDALYGRSNHSRLRSWTTRLKSEQQARPNPLFRRYRGLNR